jgi:hypothetical protein
MLNNMNSTLISSTCAVHICMVYLFVLFSVIQDLVDVSAIPFLYRVECAVDKDGGVGFVLGGGVESDELPHVVSLGQWPSPLSQGSLELVRTVSFKPDVML